MIEKKEVVILVGKESKEVIDAVVGIIADIKAKKEVAEIVAGSLPSLMTAVDGYDKLDDEMKSDSRNETVAYAGLQITEVLAPDGQSESAE